MSLGKLLLVCLDSIDTLAWPGLMLCNAYYLNICIWTGVENSIWICFTGYLFLDAAHSRSEDTRYLWVLFLQGTKFFLNILAFCVNLIIFISVMNMMQEEKTWTTE